jgi:hypothetical protein
MHKLTRMVSGFFERLTWAVDNLFGMSTSTINEYVELFVIPLKERADKLGIPENISTEMWRSAVDQSSPDVPPGVIMRRLIDKWEHDNARGNDA